MNCIVCDSNGTCEVEEDNSLSAREQISETIAKVNSIATASVIALVGATSAFAMKINPQFWYIANSIQIARTVTLLNVPLPITLEKYFNDELGFVSFNIPYLDQLTSPIVGVDLNIIQFPNGLLENRLSKYKVSSPFFIGQLLENFITYITAHAGTFIFLALIQLLQCCFWKIPSLKGKVGEWKSGWLKGFFFNITLRVYMEHCLDLLILAFVGVVTIH